MYSKIRRVVEKAIVIKGQHIHRLVYEDNYEIVDFEYSDVWADIEKMK
ncbi:hypothetical protein [Clostridium cadaveris]|nr:hypothetical protein [Clostridium cadaveris]NWK12561.1 hypothetical protein [Clostridium cadaveris]